MKNYVLEACVDSVESAIAAQKGGASRLELCSNLVIGGTTPSPQLLKEIRKNTNIPIRVLIRPRFGDFCYTSYEFDMIYEEIKMFKELGAEGVVLGILKPDGTLNMEQMQLLMEASRGMKVTLHRAFDVSKDPLRTLKEAMELGIDTILTSGQKNTCMEGKELLKILVEKSQDRIEIMVGSGVDAAVIREIQIYTRARAYHMSGKVAVESAMSYCKEGVNMGMPMLNEFEIWRTQEEKIKKAKEVLDMIH
ncbi:copper homeostasis protein CutC [Lachnospiraceae bacterium LCP25S3_G4]